MQILSNYGVGGGYDQAQRNDLMGTIFAVGNVNTPPPGHWSGGIQLGSPCAHYPGSCSTGEPIDLGSGNMFYEATDYTTDGQNPLAFTRYFNSMAAPGSNAVSLGANWRHNYDRSLTIINPSAVYGVTAERPDGQIISFTSNSGTYTTDTDLDYKLTRSGSTWTLTDRNDTSEIYYSSGTTKGLLQSIKLRNGYTQAMNYSGSAIAFVSDSYGRQLGLSYSSAGLLTGVTTPDSLALSYGYVTFSSGAQTHLSTVSYNTSPTTSQTYLYENASFPAALTGITDENGKRYATWSYDGTGRATLSQLAGAVNFTSVSYDDSTGNRSVKGPLGQVETYKFSVLQGVPKITEIDRAANGTVAAATKTFSYDANGYTASITDWNGNITGYTNNGRGQPTQIVYASTTPNAQTTNIAYDATWPHLPYSIATNGVTAEMIYASARGDLLTGTLIDTTTQTAPYVTKGQKRTWTYTWTSTGQLLSAQQPRTDVTAKTTLAYAGGTLTSITDALGHATNVITYQGGGLPLTVYDPNGVKTTYAYSPRNWLTSSILTTSVGTLTSSFTYDSAGNLTRATLPDGSYLAYGYDDAHRANLITNALNETQNITYNSAGNITQALWKNASAVNKFSQTATYDSLGRMLTSVGGASQSTGFTYDNNGNVLTVTSPLGYVTTNTYDQLDRLKDSTDAATNKSTITYDSHSRISTVKDPKSNTTSYVYNGFGDLIQQTSPDSGVTVYTYDPDSNLTDRVQAGINFTSATYDALDRISTRTYPLDSTINEAFTYDQTGTHGYGVGQLTSVIDAAGQLSQAFDERGLLTSSIRTLSSGAYTTGYTYESAGRLSSITYASSGWKASYTRDAAGQITSVSATQPGHSAATIATGIAWQPFGPVRALTWGNGVTDTRTYDFAYRTLTIRDTGTSGDIQYLSYGYDADDNVKAVVDFASATNNQQITYDNLDRITYASSGAYTLISSITYDSNSNRKSFSGTGYTVAAGSNQITKVGGSTNLTYTSAGNMNAFGASQAMTYSQANRLATATAFGASNTYTYDAFGQRVLVKPGSNPLFVQQYDQAENLLEETPGNTVNDYIYVAGMPVAVIKTATPTTSYIHTDRIAFPQKATSAAQATVWSGTPNPFGSVTPTTSITMNVRGMGQYADSTPYYYNNARYAYPGLNTFLEADPIGLNGGINPYIIGYQNPLTWLDPSGLNAWCMPTDRGMHCNGIYEGGGYVYMGGGGGPSIRPSAPPEPVKPAAPTGAQCAPHPENLPPRMARVIPGKGPFPTLGKPSDPDVFVTDPADIAGLTPAQISQRLAIKPSDTFTVIEFPTPATGWASPILRSDPGFIGKARTGGGAREFVIPNGPIPPGSTIKIIGPGQ